MVLTIDSVKLCLMTQGINLSTVREQLGESRGPSAIVGQPSAAYRNMLVDRRIYSVCIIVLDVLEAYGLINCGVMKIGCEYFLLYC